MHDALDGPLRRDLSHDAGDGLFVARVDATDLDLGACVHEPAHDVGSLGFGRARSRQEHKPPAAALKHPRRQAAPETAQTADEEIGRFGGEADGFVGLADLQGSGEWLAHGELERKRTGQ